MSSSRFASLLVLFAVAQSCDGGDAASTHRVTLDVRTDVRPGDEFSAVDVSVSHSAGIVTRSAPALAVDDFIAGQRVAEVEVSRGIVTIDIVLRDADGRSVLHRAVHVDSEREATLVVALSRSCCGVRCPGSDDGPAAETCLAGQCIPVTCNAEADDDCPTGLCDEATGCVPGGEPASGVCAAEEIVDAGAPDVPGPFDAMCDMLPLAEQSPECPENIIACVLDCQDDLSCLNGCDAPLTCFACYGRYLQDCAVASGCAGQFDCLALCEAPYFGMSTRPSGTECTAELEAFRLCMGERINDCPNDFGACVIRP